jgi:hypothetical protein
MPPITIQNMAKKVLVFGSPNDTLAWDVADMIGEIPGFSFVRSQNPDDIMALDDTSMKNMIIMDSVRGIAEPKLLSTEDLKKRNIITSHDLDAGFVLLLMKKMNRIDDAKIIGIPLDAELTEDLAERVKLLLIKLQ